MAIYPFRCQACALQQDHWIAMSDYRSGARPNCEACDGELARLVVPVGEVGTENTFKPRWDHMLSPGGDPVLVNSRADWKRMMSERGVMPAEAGMARDRTRELADRRNKAEADNWKKIEPSADRAFEQALATRNTMSDETAANVVGRIRDEAQNRAA